MSEGRTPERLKEGIELVKGIIDRVCINNKDVGEHGLKYDHPSYEVWVTYQKKIIVVQSLTPDMILYCTDHDGETALKFQAFIEKCIRRGMEALITNIN